MDYSHLLDWLNLLLRWAHVITGVAWIGASFYFVALDNSLTPPADAKEREKGIGGELWAVHGGGFYHQQKYPVSPAVLPERLHWSMWESYSTWLTGFALFTVLYLFNASTFLIDKSVHDWSPAAAVSAALGFFVGFWLIYDGICRVFGQRKNGDAIVGMLVFVFVVFASWLSCQLFAGRAAFLLVGAMLATTMSGNVFFWIIPGQRKVVAALRAGQPVDPVHGKRGKQRSVHNTYFTLPVLFTMISNHYGFLYAGQNNWVVLVVMMLAGALIRQSFVQRHKAHATGQPVPWWYAMVGVVLLAGVFSATMPSVQAPSAEATPVSFAEVQKVVGERCVMCHSEQVVNKAIQLHTPELIERNAQAVYQQAVVLKLMPLNNATQMTDAERALIKRWYEARTKP
ncbi:urate hydroxylase PuuD [Piscinibacter gummiphilus]|uniref:Urate hydroxylase PuuD n=1 Tax=Piscinibacter gummiphilus TaxID=946333 RepID=A0ABZ0CYG9_9BURK|nr:urate hydroxylase PuuD [Piscinibacter gummiphilus]WOB09984.1 urate hydroxylase PuuD [Piscinibacter gummiphilus]